MQHFTPGIYFDLPEDDYHADPAIGSTDLKQLLTNPTRYWWKSQYAATFREVVEAKTAEENEKVSRAKAFGSCVHAVTLEGMEAFNARYFVPPPKPDDLLTTIEQMRTAITDAGLWAESGLVKSAARIEYVKACRALGIGPLADDWALEVERQRDGREIVSPGWAVTLSLIARQLDSPRASHGGKSIRERVLSNGHAEVSVFWTTEDGVRCKARFDYLRVKSIVDAKTFAARDDVEVIRAFCMGIRNFGYALQAEHYRDARAQIGGLLDAKFVYQATAVTGVEGEGDDAVEVTRTELSAIPADHPRFQFLQRVAAERDPSWIWLTIQTLGFPEVDVLELKTSTISAAANTQMLEARAKWKANAEKHGTDQPWVADRPLIQIDDLTLETMGLARSMVDMGAEQWSVS